MPNLCLLLLGHRDCARSMHSRNAVMRNAMSSDPGPGNKLGVYVHVFTMSGRRLQIQHS